MIRPKDSTEGVLEYAEVRTVFCHHKTIHVKRTYDRHIFFDSVVLQADLRSLARCTLARISSFTLMIRTSHFPVHMRDQGRTRPISSFLSLPVLFRDQMESLKCANVGANISEFELRSFDSVFMIGGPGLRHAGRSLRVERW